MPQEGRAEAVPRLYKVAANVYKDFKDGKDSIKNLTYSARKKHPNIKAIYALVMEAANHAQAIEEAAQKIDLFTKEPRFQRELAFVLITELLFGKKSLPGTSLPIQTAQRYQSQLQSNLNGLDVKSKKDKLSSIPKYARVNSLCNSIHRVARTLREDGWFELMYDKQSTSYSKYLEIVTSLGDKSYVVDYHLDNLLVFPPKTQLYDHPLVKDGSLLLQDKASCLPVHALAPPPGSVVLDACSAPGMKTSQIAGLVCGDWVAAMGGDPPKGAKVIAVERSTKRCEVLKEILNRSRGSCVATVMNQDFLGVEPDSTNLSDVEYIVLDPSCSGTGMVKRSSAEEAPPSQERLQSLASIQKMLLTHALNFPNVKRVVYSTCATSRHENEDVVNQVLEGRKDWATCKVLPSWERRGEGEAGDAFLRADPDLDLCNGFFVAVIQRTQAPLQPVALENYPKAPSYKKIFGSNDSRTPDEYKSTDYYYHKNDMKKKNKKFKEYAESPFSDLNKANGSKEPQEKKKKGKFKEYAESPFSNLNSAADEQGSQGMSEKKKKKQFKEYAESPFSDLNKSNENVKMEEAPVMCEEKKKKQFKEYAESPFSDLSKSNGDVKMEESPALSKKKKKKLYKEYAESPFSDLNKTNVEEEMTSVKEKKKKKRKNEDTSDNTSTPVPEEQKSSHAKKKKKKDKKPED